MKSKELLKSANIFIRNNHMYHLAISSILYTVKKYKRVKDEKIWKICKYTHRDNKQKKIFICIYR